MTIDVKERNERHAPTLKGEARRNRLIEVATQEFLTVGYAQTSMKSIVQKAGGSAETAYQLFNNKEGLLSAVMQREFDGLETSFFPDSVIKKPPNSALPTIALKLLSYIVRPRSVDFYRLLVAEGHRDPQIADYFRHLLTLQILSPLEKYLREAVTRGDLKIDDPVRAAKLLSNLVQGMAHEARMAGGYPDGPSAADKDICRYSINALLEVWQV